MLEDRNNDKVELRKGNNKDIQFYFAKTTYQE